MLRVAVLMCVKDEADIIAWSLERWATLGTTDFYICDRASSDDTVKEIMRFNASTSARVVFFTKSQTMFDNHMVINEMKNTALGDGINWMFPADADESICLPTGCNTIQEWLIHYPQRESCGTIPYCEPTPDNKIVWHTHRKAFGFFNHEMGISIGNHKIEIDFRFDGLDTKNAYYIHRPYRTKEQYRQKTINLMTAFKDGPTDNERHKQYLRWQAGGEAELQKIMQEHLSHTYPTWYYL